MRPKAEVARPKDPAIQSFLAYLSLERGASPRTIESYESTAYKLLNFLAGGSRTPFDWSSVTQQQIQDFILVLRRAGYATNSVYQRIATLKSMFTSWSERSSSKQTRLPTTLPTNKRRPPRADSYPSSAGRAGNGTGPEGGGPSSASAAAQPACMDRRTAACEKSMVSPSG